jgi:hypothetical protein
LKSGRDAHLKHGKYAALRVEKFEAPTAQSTDLAIASELKKAGKIR